MVHLKSLASIYSLENSPASSALFVQLSGQGLFIWAVFELEMHQTTGKELGYWFVVSQYWVYKKVM